MPQCRKHGTYISARLHFRILSFCPYTSTLSTLSRFKPIDSNLPMRWTPTFPQKFLRLLGGFFRERCTRMASSCASTQDLVRWAPLGARLQPLLSTALLSVVVHELNFLSYHNLVRFASRVEAFGDAVIGNLRSARGCCPKKCVLSSGG